MAHISYPDSITPWLKKARKFYPSFCRRLNPARCFWIKTVGQVRETVRQNIVDLDPKEPLTWQLGRQEDAAF
jgi:hypothetical protein